MIAFYAFLINHPAKAVNTRTEQPRSVPRQETQGQRKSGHVTRKTILAAAAAATASTTKTALMAPKLAHMMVPELWQRTTRLCPPS